MTEIEDGFKDLEDYFKTRLGALKSLSDIQKRPKIFHIEEPTGILSKKKIGERSLKVEESIGIIIKEIGKVKTDNIEDMQRYIGKD